MALTERDEQQVTVLPDGQLQVRVATIIERDGRFLSRSYHRHVVDVGDDVTNEPQMIKDIASVMHTPQRKAARDAFKATQRANEAQ